MSLGQIYSVLFGAATFPECGSEGHEREQERWPGCLPEPNDSCSCTIVYGGVWRAELPHAVFVKSRDVTHLRKQWLSLSINFFYTQSIVYSA